MCYTIATPFLLIMMQKTCTFERYTILNALLFIRDCSRNRQQRVASNQRHCCCCCCLCHVLLWSHVKCSPSGLRDWQTELKKRLNAAATAPDEKHENVVRYFTSIQSYKYRYTDTMAHTMVFGLGKMCSTRCVYSIYSYMGLMCLYAFATTYTF